MKGDVLALRAKVANCVSLFLKETVQPAHVAVTPSDILFMHLGEKSALPIKKPHKNFYVIVVYRDEAAQHRVLQAL